MTDKANPEIHSADIAISVRNLSKTYRLFKHPGDRIKQFLSLGFKQYHHEFAALNDVSFDIRKGETVGIIGRNGSGKSTLLQLICGILKPTSGSVQVSGRVSALLELGAGFNPEFTGRENVFFQGAIMGIPRDDMGRRFDDIASFADIGEFLDQPVRTYSSGMFVRLAFAVAVHVTPDILVIDEALAVGDVEFQRKCFDKISEMQKQGTTFLIVSHSPYWIERLCHRAAIMEHGHLSQLWQARDVLHRYHRHILKEINQSATHVHARREGTQEISFKSVGIETVDGSPAATIQNGAPFRIVAEINAKRPMKNIRFRFAILSAGQEIVTQACSNGVTEKIVYMGTHRIEFQMESCQLTSGSYSINTYIGDGLLPLDEWNNATSFQVHLTGKEALDLSSDNGIFVCRGRWAQI
jgi:lipopolysaccharide transport system ATP-binding protein